MAMKTLWFKGKEENPQNSAGSFSVARTWNPNMAFQTVYNGSYELFRDQTQNPHTGNARRAFMGLGELYESEKTDCAGDGEKRHLLATFSSFPAIADYHPQLNSGNFPRIICGATDQSLGRFGAFSPVSGRVMLPMNVETDDPPVFVNPKQYHGILRRRKSRAKFLLRNKGDNKRQPYMHYSRHLHAKRRPRGSGGRFLNTKNLLESDGGKAAASQPAGSHSSEVLQSDGACLAAAPSSTLEVTSTIHQTAIVELDTFKHFIPPTLSFPGIVGSSRGIASEWLLPH